MCTWQALLPLDCCAMAEMGHGAKANFLVYSVRMEKYGTSAQRVVACAGVEQNKHVFRRKREAAPVCLAWYVGSVSLACS